MRYLLDTNIVSDLVRNLRFANLADVLCHLSLRGWTAR